MPAAHERAAAAKKSHSLAETQLRHPARSNATANHAGPRAARRAGLARPARRPARHLCRTSKFEQGNSFADELRETAKYISSRGKGILASDESNATTGKRLASVGVENTEDNRRAWRETLYTAPGLGEYISGALRVPVRLLGTQLHCAALTRNALPLPWAILAVAAVQNGNVPDHGLAGTPTAGRTSMRWRART